MMIADKYLLIGQDQTMIKKKITALLEEWKKTSPHLGVEWLVWKKRAENNHQWKEKLGQKNFFTKQVLVINITHLAREKIATQSLIWTTLAKITHHLILTSEKKITPQLPKTEGEKFKIVLVGKFNQREKIKLIQQQLKDEKIILTPKVEAFLITNLTNDYQILAKELAKITAFFFQQKEKKLSLTLARKIITSTTATTIFPLLEALLTNDLSAISYHLEKTREKISLLVLLATINTYLWQMKKITSLLKAKITFPLIVKKMKKPPFMVINLIKIVKITSPDHLDNLTKKITQLETNYKLFDLQEETLWGNFLSLKKEKKE